MNNSDPKIQTPVDVSRIRNSLTAGQSKLVPTIIIRSEGDDSEGSEQTQGKVKLLERIVKTEILLNILLVLILMVTLYVFFVMRSDIQKYLNKETLLLRNKNTQSEGSTSNFRVAAAEKEAEGESAVYINRVGVNLDKAFAASVSGKITAHGRFKSEVMGFLPYWIVPQIDQINTQSLTSVSFFGLEVDRNGEIIKYDAGGQPLEAWTYLQKDKNLDSFFKKARNKKIKVYLTLKNFNQDNIIALTTSEKARERFINSAIYLMGSKSFDGLNIDFEYIGTPDQKVRDGFSALIIDLYKIMREQYPGTVLTIDTFVDAASATRIHDIPVLAQNSDGLVIMGYDFHTPQSSVPGPVAPMEGGGVSIKGLMASYLDKAPADKLILGVPYYGYDWPVKQTGDKFEVSGVKQEVNAIPYAEIAEVTKRTKILWDENAQVPWYSYLDAVTNQNRVVYFENVRSLSVKYDYIKQNKLQGVAIWALGFDGKKTELAQTLIDKFSE